MRSRFSRSLLAAGLAGAALLAAPQLAQAAPARSAAVPAVAPASAGTAGSVTRSASADVCYFETQGDYVHVSSSAFEASGHGWWINIDCDTTTAVVTVQLEEYYSDGSWRKVGTVGKKTVRSGGGSSDRSTGRAGCTGSGAASWRSVVDVDLVGLADDPGKLTTTDRVLNCTR